MISDPAILSMGGATLDRAASFPSARAGPGALPAGRSCDSRDRHCLAGDHFRRVFPDPAGGPAGLPAAHAHPAHGKPRDRPDLCAPGQLAAGGGDAGRRGRFRHVGRARRRLWHRRVAADGDHHPAGRPRRHPVGLFADHRDRGERLLLSSSIASSSPRTRPSSSRAAGFRCCSPASSRS